jgi:hypothetical protein
MAAAGVPLDEALAGANLYGSFFSDYTKQPVDMDPIYTGIPEFNVIAISDGYVDELRGTLCTTQ